MADYQYQNDLYFTVIKKVLQRLNEINASLQKLLSRNEKCDDDTDADNDTDDDKGDGRHDPFVSAMLWRQHSKYTQHNLNIHLNTLLI